MNAVLSILDVNANRAREALRVLEEVARFAMKDATLTGRLKKTRHELAIALRPYPELPLQRIGAADGGRAITLAAEKNRIGLHDIAAAAAKRAQEALRCLEEFAKPLAPALSRRAKALRYEIYDLEQLLLLRLGSPRRRQWRLCLLLTQELCRKKWQTVAAEALDAGADAIQIREKNLEDRPLLQRTQWLLKEAAGRAAIIVNDRVAVAWAAGAAGVHLGRNDLPVNQTRRLLGPEFLIGASTHNLKEAKQALAAGADYCGVGAMFVTATKKRAPSGLKYLRNFMRQHKIAPHLAIGGIGPHNVADVLKAGARGVAVSSAICGDEHPGRVVKRLLSLIRTAEKQRHA